MRTVGVRSAALSVESRVEQAGVAGRGVRDTAVCRAAAAEGLPGLRAGEGVLVADVNSPVGKVELLLSGRRFRTLCPAVREGESGVLTAAGFEAPDGGVSRRVVTFVPRYAAARGIRFLRRKVRWLS